MTKVRLLVGRFTNQIFDATSRVTGSGVVWRVSTPAGQQDYNDDDVQAVSEEEAALDLTYSGEVGMYTGPPINSVFDFYIIDHNSPARPIIGFQTEELAKRTASLLGQTFAGSDWKVYNMKIQASKAKAACRAMDEIAKATTGKP